MKSQQLLSAAQQALAEDSLPLVHWVIHQYISTNESICGLGYEDLYQEGSLALCRAAATYDAKDVQFKTYAVTVIRNHLIDYCRRITAQRKNTLSVSIDVPSGEGQPPAAQHPALSVDTTDECISRLYVSQLLTHGKRSYRGVARLGVEALELKIKGYSGADIARLYHTQPNHVGAWISRAADKLRKDAAFLGLIEPGVEKSTSGS